MKAGWEQVGTIGLALILSASGCSYNPSYFPYLLPGGPVVQHHAKPAGRGYFHNYDPKAYKVEISPGDQIQAPLGAAIVLVGTVFDKDGQPRRSRRIEWILEGVGTIVEADESGFYPGRGYKVNNHYAVTYTNYRTHTITRGNDDPADDVVIAPGQTFCVVSSSVPGETIVTAYAPEVFSWSNSRASVRIIWGEGRIQFPPPAVVRWGGEWILTTRFIPTDERDSAAHYRVRYRLLDGPAAELIPRGGSGTAASRSGQGGREAEVYVDAEGQAAVRLIQTQPQPGKNRIAIEIVQLPNVSGGEGQVIARRETTVEWAAPDVGLTVQLPRTAGVEAPFPAKVVLDNTGAVDSQEIDVRVRLSGELSLAWSEPPPRRIEADNTLVFVLPPVPARGRQELQLRLIGKQKGTAQLHVQARSADGLQAVQHKTVELEAGRLHAVLEAPSLVFQGERFQMRLAATNAGAAPIDNATAWIDTDAGLISTSATRPLELTIGRLEPGQTRTLDVSLQAQQTGQWQIRATVTADGQLSVTAPAAMVEVRSARAMVSIQLPPMIYLQQECVAAVTVSNRGELPLTNGLLRLLVPAELGVVTADNGGRVVASGVEWELTELAPSAQRTFSLRLRGERLSERATLTALFLADAGPGRRLASAPLQARTDANIAIIGVPALVLELAAPTGVLPLGQRLSYQIRVKNVGTLAARDVAPRLVLSDHFRLLQGVGPGGSVASNDTPGQIIFPPVAELSPGATAVFRLDVETTRPGTGRIRAEVRAQHLQRPLVEEQPATITAR
ncbi:MAG: hypothetical protein RMJ88_12515 [Thermogemmata sp.]|nr:hypothetical protein [Thermogemmata sp.]